MELINVNNQEYLFFYDKVETAECHIEKCSMKSLVIFRVSNVLCQAFFSGLLFGNDFSQQFQGFNVIVLT